MDKPCLELAVLPLISIALIVVSLNGVIGVPQFPAMFVFGDSLVDNGNNNYINSLAKANYVPYGIDFYSGPTGRFCNGKSIIDFLGDLLGLPLLPAFVTTFTGGTDIRSGVNYASAAAGILDDSGKNLGDRFSLSQQVQNFEGTLSQLKNLMDTKELSQYLAKSLVVMILGSNDYINNYLLPSIYSTSSTYNPADYADLLIKHYTRHILALYNLGLSKILVAGVGPLGCMPNQLAINLAPPGQCVSSVNDMVGIFNVRLKSLVDQLNTNYTGAIFVYGNTYGVFTDILNKPATYGFSVTDRGCCGIGRNRGQITCLPFSIPCFYRDQYVFWDAYHPTQALNEIIARRAYTGAQSDCYPINVKQMAQEVLFSYWYKKRVHIYGAFGSRNLSTFLRMLEDGNHLSTFGSRNPPTFLGILDFGGNHLPTKYGQMIPLQNGGNVIFVLIIPSIINMKIQDYPLSSQNNKAFTIYNDQTLITYLTFTHD